MKRVFLNIIHVDRTFDSSSENKSQIKFVFSDMSGTCIGTIICPAVTSFWTPSRRALLIGGLGICNESSDSTPIRRRFGLSEQSGVAKQWVLVKEKSY